MLPTSTSTFTLSPRRQAKIQNLYHSRLQLAISALVLQTLIMIFLMRTFLSIVGFFNIPAILALVACTYQPRIFSRQAQRTTKTMLKVGIAKAIGGILLAVFMGLKYVSIWNAAESSQKTTVKLCAIYLAVGAVVDILYSVFALMAIKNTKSILKLLRRRSSQKKVETQSYDITEVSEDSLSSSSSCSEMSRESI